MIANADENMGELEDFLSETGLRENSILIFMSDNGCASTEAVAIHNSGMRGRKTDNWEGGHRVPCFVRWPNGHLGEPRDIDELTHMQDLLPTLGGLCGLNGLPDAAAFDGVSLAPLLKGAAKRLDDRMLIVQYGQGCEKWNRTAVMWKKWRLLGESELYDLSKDPHQDANVAGGHPDVVQAMRANYETWRRRVEPLFNETRYIRIGSKRCNPTMLYASDWDGDYCDNPQSLAKGTAVGTWHVIVEQDGQYEFELRRWAKEANLPLSAPADAGNPASARPIAKARLKIGDFDRVIDMSDGATKAVFTAPLKPGKTKIETWFLDGNSNVLCSAFYTEVRKE